jgi:hypothetical protein
MLFIKPVFAVCPVCVVAVGSGLAIAEAFGVDDLLAAIWIGALITSSAFWMADKFKLIKLPRPEISWSFIFYLLTIGTLYIDNKLGNPYCRIWGLDKIWLGVTLGALFFWIGVIIDRIARKTNNDKVYFPFQKVILPILAIVIPSLILYLTVCK